MFGSTVLEVAMGMIVCFGSIALIASSVQEAFASMLRWRAKTLFTGVTDLLNGQSLVLDVYNHALVNPRSDGKATTLADIPSKYAPSYIEPANFAQALVDSLQKGQVAFAALRPVIVAITDVQLRTCLLGMYDRAGGDVNRFEAAIAGWFDSAMDRISGAYKRKSQFWTFVFALAIAVGFNVDAHQVMATLWALTVNGHAPGTVAVAPTTVQGALSSLDQLPIGWHRLSSLQTQLLQSAVLWAVPGWVVTATAALFGAPFWFGLLGKVADLRGVGTKPAQENPNQGKP
jgi:hypothetical protein